MLVSFGGLALLCDKAHGLFHVGLSAAFTK